MRRCRANTCKKKLEGSPGYCTTHRAIRDQFIAAALSKLAAHNATDEAVFKTAIDCCSYADAIMTQRIE